MKEIIFFLLFFFSIFSSFGQTNLPGGILTDLGTSGYSYTLRCPSDTDVVFQQDDLIIIGKPKLIKKYGDYGLYSIHSESIIYGTNLFDKCEVIFIYGTKELIESSNTFFLYITYYVTMDTALPHLIPSLYFSVNGAKNLTKLSIEKCKKNENQIEWDGASLTKLPFNGKLKRNKIEKKIERWKKINCH
jgi:hypothetical protein